MTYYKAARTEIPKDAKSPAGRKHQTENHNIYKHVSGYGYYIRVVVNNKKLYGGFATNLEEAKIKRDKFFKELNKKSNLHE